MFAALAWSRLSVSEDDRKIERAKNGISCERDPGSSPLSLPDPARRPPAFSIVHTDREPGTGYCSMCVRFATQQRDTCGLIYHQIKYFAKANSAFTIFLHRRHGRFVVYQFKTVSLFSNRDSKVTKRIPSSSSSSSSVTSPSSKTRLDSAERSN